MDEKGRKETMAKGNAPGTVPVAEIRARCAVSADTHNKPFCCATRVASLAPSISDDSQS